jgi:4-amino-4-deoxychorismate lyase
MSRFFESIRIEDGKAWNMMYHEQRVLQTVRDNYSSLPAWNLADAVTKGLPEHGLFKCRIVYDAENYAVDFERYTIKTIASLKVVEANDIDYRYKYFDRSALNKLYMQRGAHDDILIIKNGRVTDTSYANIVLSDKAGTWHTPADCLLKGTMRQSLIDSGRIIEKTIGPDDLKFFKNFKVINAMRNMGVGESQVSNID